MSKIEGWYTKDNYKLDVSLYRWC